MTINFLTIAGLAGSAVILVESWLQLTGKPYGIVKWLNEAGMTTYKVAKEPNKGIWHLTGWLGSACFVIMMLYSFRKRFKFMVDAGPIRLWLDVHIFLGIVGTVLITVHSTYKFGGIVSLSYWSAVLVALSGILGRYLYVKIPRSVTGNELMMGDLDESMETINAQINKYESGPRVSSHFDGISTEPPDEESGALASLFAMAKADLENMGALWRVRAELKGDVSMPAHVKHRLYWLIKEKRRLVRSRMFLDVSHKLLHHWHVFHKPFAVIMFIVMFLHIGVFYLFKV